ncbi:STN and carboxypeptidase regulatory-like domain-containing protein [Pedobacter heparinus]|uniref:STN and carboxypeptidase regulatory-like domain-containing protein n=1 Tax=Pedobacter heparinus TaxID=984 RepID=UPI00292D0C22|nr:STN and carboxypeptidase regulatory-like domain-containing protein [Pedobacter heparinus]
MKLKLTLILLVLNGYLQAQMPLAPARHNLEKRVSITLSNTSISEVLKKVSRAGEFYFSYSGTLFKQDSLVSLDIRNEPVREILNKLFNNKVDYKENGDYIILRYAANHLTIEPENITTAEKLYLISGYVIDTETGRKVKQASVYEKRLLQSTLTDQDGFFKLRFKGDHTEVILTASKENYRDTTLIFLSDIKVKPEGYKDSGSDEANGVFSDVESSGLGRFFISSRQRIQSLNIPSFFANSPFQTSLTPGLSSHGIMSAQVINKFSLNVLGGYTAGTNGFEIAGLFNITKGDVKKLQFAGLFNEAGGSLNGFQVAGLLNNVRGEKKGFQAAGLLNRVKENTEGFQVAGLCNLSYKNMMGAQAAGIMNLVAENAHGVQIAGIANLVRKDMDGTQVAGIGNMTRHLKGVQIAGIFNYAKRMDGFQVGLINVSDTSSGYSLGLINFVKRGYHKISVFANETVNTNISVKTGNSKLYTILFAGLNLSENEKVRTAGLGLGHDFLINNRWAIGLETTGQLLYLGNWDSSNLLSRVQANVQVQLVKGITLFAGPAYSVYSSDNPANSSSAGYKQNVVPKHHTSFGSTTKGWLGFNAGITFL